MISSVPSYDEELLNSAYANIGLIADKGWAFHQDDPFRKLNHTLWVQNCKLNARFRDNGNYQPRCVRDTIPGSWLAQYGNYEYNEDRERMYKPGDNTPVIRQSDLYNGAITEPWMLEEVEEHFTRLSSRTSLPLDDEQSTQSQSSATDRLDLPGKVTARETGRITQPKWDVVLRKRYSTLEQVLAAKTSNGKDSAPWTSYTTNIDEHYNKNVDPEDYIKYPPLRYTVDNMAEMQLQIHVTSDVVRDLWNPLKSPQQQQQQQKHFHYSQRHQQHPQCIRQQQHHLHCNKQPQYLQCGLQHQTFALRSGRQPTCSESIGMMRQPPPPMLSAEVPEFFPKGPMYRSKGHQEQSIPLQFFPSSAERCYQDELFPYNRGHIPGSGNVYQSTSIPISRIPIQQVSNPSSLIRPSHQWIQRPSPALHVQVPVCPSAPHQSVCTSVQSVFPAIIQRRIEMHDKLAGNVTLQGGRTSVPIPVYQRPPELYGDPSQRRKNQGVDFNNLILLTKNAMKARRHQSKNLQQTSSFILDSRQPNLKSETDVLQWLEKGYPKKAEDFVAVDLLVSDLRNFEEKSDKGKTASAKRSTEDMNPNANNLALTALYKSPEKLNTADPSSDPPTKRRLYRDVLTNSSSTGIVLENVFDKRYDELERQAMEQYRTSEECLALRYQELERQALEQYRNSDNGAGSTSNNQSQNSSPATPTKGKPRDESKSVTEDKKCVGGHKCSGFGHCSPIKDSPSASEKGTPTRQPLTILRPESKPGTSSTHRVADRNKCSRPAIVTKSLTTLSQRFTRDSKNTTRGASGDKIDRTVQASPKRRLILMSPSKRESEARPTKTSADLEEMYAFQPVKTHVSGSYRRPAVIKTGGGDEKVTILRSPGSEGIRKQLFLDNEELMDSSSESLGVRLLEPTEIDGPCTKMNLVENLKGQTIDVSPGTSVDTIIDPVRREDEEEPSVFDIRRTIWKRPLEHRKISTRITRNKKKQCKLQNLIAAEEIKFHRPNPLLTKSIIYFPRDEKCEVELLDIIPQSNVPTSKEHRGLRKPNSKLKLKSKYRKTCPMSHCSPMTFEKRNYLTITDFLCCSSSIPETMAYSVSLCRATDVDISRIFIHNDSHLFPKLYEYDTTQIHFQNQNSFQNSLWVRHYVIVPSKSEKIPCSLTISPFQILPSWDNSQVNDLPETISSGTALRRIQMNNLSSTDDCTQSYPVEYSHEAVCEFYFDLVTLQLFPPVSFMPIFDGKQNSQHYRKENVYYIMTDLETMFPFYALTSNVDSKLGYL